MLLKKLVIIIYLTNKIKNINIEIMKKILYLASKNPGKILEYKKMLSKVNCQLLLQPQSIDVLEDGQTFHENAYKKASKVSSETNNYAIADDSGLCINALGGSPGIFSSRFAETDEERIKKVLRKLEGIENREAFFLASICLFSPKGELILSSEARCYGNIVKQYRGSNGFGYDPIFEEKTSKLTFAEMKNDIKEIYSHRGRALEKMIPDLKKIFN